MPERQKHADPEVAAGVELKDVRTPSWRCREPPGFFMDVLDASRILKDGILSRMDSWKVLKGRPPGLAGDGSWSLFALWKVARG